MEGLPGTQSSAMCTHAPLPVPRDATALVLLRMEAGLGQGPGILGTLSSWCQAPQEGMGWSGLCLQLGLNLSITTQHWKLGDHVVLRKILLLLWPRTHWEVLLGMLPPRDAGAPAAWSCWDAAGWDPACCHTPGHSSMQDCLTPQPCSVGVTTCREQPFSSPSCQCALAVLRILWGP